MKNSKYGHLSLFYILTVLIFTGCSLSTPEVSATGDLPPLLGREFNLGGKRTVEPHSYSLETVLYHNTPDGKRSRIETFRVELEVLPPARPDKSGEEIICRKFTIQRDSEPPVSIPSLEGWSYIFQMDLDDQNRVFGIEHEKFENLKAEDGLELPADTAYFIYNSFIDFHGFCDVFAGRMEEGGGIQDLKAIGQKIVHASAFSEPPVNLGSHIDEGSTFRNGEVTLELKGLSRVAGRPCSLIGFDSGESSFTMLMTPVPDMKIKTVGSSHYWGDLYVDLETSWVLKVDMNEFVVSETSLPMPPHKINGVVERKTVIRSLSASEPRLKKRP